MKEEKKIHELISELLKLMGFDVKVKIEKQNRPDAYIAQITAEEKDAPLLIGYHGETIRDLQTVLEPMLYKEFNRKIAIAVNVNDYREKQKERLEHIAEDVAQKVKLERESRRLSSFSAYERKVIHEYIAKNHPDLVSSSEGEGVDRRLIVSLKTQTAV